VEVCVVPGPVKQVGWKLRNGLSLTSCSDSMVEAEWFNTSVELLTMGTAQELHSF
jgi:hypothetical protein